MPANHAVFQYVQIFKKKHNESITTIISVTNIQFINT